MRDQMKAAEILNDLIKANNKCIAHYKQTVSDTIGVHNELISILESRINENSQHKQELVQKVRQLGKDVNDKPTDSEPGIWMDIRTSFISNDRKTIFSTCEHYENSILHTYEKALQAKEEMTEDVHQLIANQKEKLAVAYEMIKKHKENAAM